MVGVGLMLVTATMAKSQNFPPATEKRASWGGEEDTRLLRAFPAAADAGDHTRAEFSPGSSRQPRLSAVAVAYAMLISMFVLRSMTWRDLPNVLLRASLTSAVVLLLVGAAMAFKTVVSLSHAPEALAAFILSLSENPLYSAVPDQHLLLFIVGMFLDAGPAIIILGPILAPIFTQHWRRSRAFRHHHERQPDRRAWRHRQWDLVLFVASSVAKERVETIAKAILPFLAVEIFVIFLITYIPDVSLFVPWLTGFVDPDVPLLLPRLFGFVRLKI